MALYTGTSIQGFQELFLALQQDSGILNIVFQAYQPNRIFRFGWGYVIAQMDFGVGPVIIDSFRIDSPGVLRRLNLAAPVLNQPVRLIANWNVPGLAWRVTF